MQFNTTEIGNSRNVSFSKRVSRDALLISCHWRKLVKTDKPSTVDVMNVRIYLADLCGIERYEIQKKTKSLRDKGKCLYRRCYNECSTEHSSCPCWYIPISKCRPFYERIVQWYIHTKDHWTLVISMSSLIHKQTLFQVWDFRICLLSSYSQFCAYLLCISFE